MSLDCTAFAAAGRCSIHFQQDRDPIMIQHSRTQHATPATHRHAIGIYCHTAVQDIGPTCIGRMKLTPTRRPCGMHRNQQGAPIKFVRQRPLWRLIARAWSRVLNRKERGWLVPSATASRPAHQGSPGVTGTITQCLNGRDRCAGLRRGRHLEQSRPGLHRPRAVRPQARVAGAGSKAMQHGSDRRGVECALCKCT